MLLGQGMKRRWLASGVVLMGAMAGWGLAWATAQDSAVRTKEVADGASSRNTEASDFIRVTKTLDGELRSLQTSIVRFSAGDDHPHAGAIVDLVGAVHVGERTYYEELKERFKDYDVVLYELVAPEGTRISAAEASDRGSPISAIQGGMKEMLGLEFQLEHIDYLAKNFRHADMSPEEFMEDMASRGDSLLQMGFRMVGAGLASQASAGGQMSEINLLVAMMSQDRERQLRRAVAGQFIDMESSMAGMADASGKSTLLTERNSKALKVLRDELEQGKKRIAIFYGAGHLPDMAERLNSEFGLQKSQVEWIDAWNLILP